MSKSLDVAVREQFQIWGLDFGQFTYTRSGPDHQPIYTCIWNLDLPIVEFTLNVSASASTKKGALKQVLTESAEYIDSELGSKILQIKQEATDEYKMDDFKEVNKLYTKDPSECEKWIQTHIVDPILADIALDTESYRGGDLCLVQIFACDPNNTELNLFVDGKMQPRRLRGSILIYQNRNLPTILLQVLQNTEITKWITDEGETRVFSPYNIQINGFRSLIQPIQSHGLAPLCGITKLAQYLIKTTFIKDIRITLSNWNQQLNSSQYEYAFMDVVIPWLIVEHYKYHRLI
jgi:hypothetical protein